MFAFKHIIASKTLQPPIRPDLGYGEFQQVLAVINSVDLLRRLTEYRFTGTQFAGRKQYSPVVMWNSYILLFYLNLDSINHLVRTLRDNPCLRQICGFGPTLPHRTTFSRMFCRIADHLDLVEGASANIVQDLTEVLPDLGQEVSVDSTTVPTNGNPWRKSKKRLTDRSDPEASWTAKNSVRAKEGGKEWHYGYKFHATVDANYGIPLGGITTPANYHDSRMLIPLVEQIETYGGVKPDIVIADRGYDSKTVHQWLIEKNIVPIIHIRKSTAKGGLYDKMYDHTGAPVCFCGATTEYWFTDPEHGDAYRCPEKDCFLLELNGYVWHRLDRNYRLRGPVRRGTPEWDDLYDKRQAVERVFKSMKQSRRLVRHYHRGLRKIALHSALSMLVFQATALVKALSDKVSDMCWMTDRLA